MEELIKKTYSDCALIAQRAGMALCHKELVIVAMYVISKSVHSMTSDWIKSQFESFRFDVFDSLKVQCQCSLPDSSFRSNLLKDAFYFFHKDKTWLRHIAKDSMFYSHLCDEAMKRGFVFSVGMDKYSSLFPSLNEILGHDVDSDGSYKRFLYKRYLLIDSNVSYKEIANPFEPDTGYIRVCDLSKKNEYRLSIGAKKSVEDEISTIYNYRHMFIEEGQTIMPPDINIDVISGLQELYNGRPNVKSALDEIRLACIPDYIYSDGRILVQIYEHLHFRPPLSVAYFDLVVHTKGTGKKVVNKNEDNYLSILQSLSSGFHLSNDFFNEHLLLRDEIIACGFEKFSHFIDLVGKVLLGKYGKRFGPIIIDDIENKQLFAAVFSGKDGGGRSIEWGMTMDSEMEKAMAWLFKNMYKKPCYKESFNRLGLHWDPKDISSATNNVNRLFKEKVVKLYPFLQTTETSQ